MACPGKQGEMGRDFLDILNDSDSCDEEDLGEMEFVDAEVEYLEDPVDIMEMEMVVDQGDPLTGRQGSASVPALEKKSIIISVPADPYDTVNDDFEDFGTPDAGQLHATDMNVNMEMEMNECERAYEFLGTEEPPSESVASAGRRVSRRGQRDRCGRVRGRGYGQGRGRGRGCGGPWNGGARGGAAASVADYNWTRGDPLLEVCVDDEDVPPLLRSMVHHLEISRATTDAALRERRERKKEREKANVLERMDDEGEKDNKEDEEVFFEADDGRDEALLEEGEDRFDWSPMESFQSKRERFLPKKTGSVTKRRTMYEAFRAYWDDDILKHIVTETNRYATSIRSEAFRNEWIPTNIHEILVLFSFWMMLGIIKMPTIKSCFSTDPILKTSVFRRMFTNRRYTNLCRALQFANNDAKPPNASRLFLLDPIVNHLNKQFKANYIPQQAICIDESLTLWKGQLLFKQHIASKVARYGIKTFELCESSTGYLWSFKVYTGKSSVNEGTHLLKSTSLVIELMRPLLEKGYTLFMDNWFNSPILARYLKRHKTDCVGTLRSTRRGVPPLVSLAQLRKGEILARHSGDVAVLAWEDKKKVVTISTFHGKEVNKVDTVRGNQTSTVWKPQVVLDYNKNMGGVDRKDQMLEPYLIERKRHLKWYIKYFKRLLNVSILNSRILVESSTRQREKHLTHRLRLVDSILENHIKLVPTRRARPVTDGLVVPPRDVAHWPVRIPRDPLKSRHTQRRCVYCISNGKKDTKSTYMCEQCDAPLCIECFKDFHVWVS